MISLDRPKTGRFSGRFSGLFTSSPVLPGGYDEGRNVFAQGWGLQSVISCSLKRGDACGDFGLGREISHLFLKYTFRLCLLVVVYGEVYSSISCSLNAT